MMDAFPVITLLRTKDVKGITFAVEKVQEL